jgi:hypothetical protein
MRMILEVMEAEAQRGLVQNRMFTAMDSLTVEFYPNWARGTQFVYKHNGVRIERERAIALVPGSEPIATNVVMTMRRKALVRAFQDGPQSARPRSLHDLSKIELQEHACQVLRGGGDAAERLSMALQAAQEGQS